LSTTLRNRLAYERDRIGYLREAQRKYGDVFRFSDTATVVLDPKLIRDLFTRTNNEVGAEGLLLAGRRGRVSTANKMAVRRHGWRALSPGTFSRHESRIVELLRLTLAETRGKEVDVRTVMQTYSGRGTVEYCLGRSNVDLADAVAEAVTASEALMNSSLTLPPWLPTPKVRRLHNANAQMRGMLAERIARRRIMPHPSEPEDLLDVLLVDELDPSAVTEMVEVALRASFGQPGVALAWAILTLARRPDLADRMAAGSDEYTDAFVKELLRLYPPIWLSGREVWEPTRVGDLELRPGEQVLFSAYVVHRDPRWWDEPDVFRPERWLTGTPPHARYAYFPFGGGPRICLGRHAGFRQLALALQVLSREYDITVRDASVPMQAGALLTPVGLRARFRRRHIVRKPERGARQATAPADVNVQPRPCKV
jgi:cytochrome P450